ncbi:MAG TPA: 6-phosphogluconolactonase [Burkholderiaceae bacterium]|nr:6-phosphogluconolactonase [Burkholderiaceae bacterium]
MKIEVLADAEAAAREAARQIAHWARTCVAARGVFVMAVSGGKTPWQMLRALAQEDLPWANVHVAQVDERIAPAGDTQRNFTHLRKCLREQVPSANLHPMPVEAADLELAAARYAATLEQLAGSPAVLDLAHLGLGIDGHTASLVPDDAVLQVTDRDVALTGVYEGHRRMTLTYPILNRCRRILWLVTGAEKAGALARLRSGERSVPAGAIARDNAVVLADEAAAAVR